MSDTAIFELRTNIDKDILLKQVVQIWSNQAYTGYEVDIFNFSPDKTDTIFCELLYVFHYPEEYKKIREIANYLLKIASDNQIYYYRCGDFLGLVSNNRVVKITLNDIFTEEYRPSIGASIVEKYLIQE